VAKRSVEEVAQEKGKIRIFFAEVEGSNQSLQEALKTVTAAMNRPSQFATVRIPAAQNLQPGQVEANAMPEEAAPEIADEELVEAEPSSTPARKRGAGPKMDRNAGVKLVPNLDFHPKSDLALKDFFAGKAPKNDMEHCVVIGYYLKHTLELDSFGPGHLLTGLKEVGKPVPADLKGTIRNMRNQKAWFNFDDIEQIDVTTQGDNYVEHKLGGAK
jgi:hypothetical protein